MRYLESARCASQSCPLPSSFVAAIICDCRRLALKHHPDKATGPEAKAAAETVFVLITAANSVLSDPGKRAVYDAAYARSNSMMFGGQSHYYARSTSTSSSSQRHSSSTGMGASTYSWQHPSSTYAAGSQAAAAAARAATAAAAAAAAAAASQRWQQGSGAGRGPADSSNSANSTSSSTSGTSFARGGAATSAGMRF
jgi:curved DNA-binding protein CbpA